MAMQFNPRYFLGDKVDTVTAAGTTQGTATTLTADHAKVTTVASGANGVILKESPFPQIKMVLNADATEDLLVYPWSGASINGNTANDPLTLPAGGCAMFFCFDQTDVFCVASVL